MRIRKIAAEMVRRRKFALCVGMAILACGCGGGVGGPEGKVEAVPDIRTQKIRIQDVPEELEAPGSVIAVSTAQVAARTTGTALQVAAREGDVVRRGQLLAQLDGRELAAHLGSAHAAEQASSAGVERARKGVASAQAQAELAKKTYDRFVYLKEQKSVSAQEFDEIAAQYQAGQAGLEQAKAALQQAEAEWGRSKSELQAAASAASYARIVAPFDGRVTRRTVEPGSLVSPGAVLFVEEDSSHYQFEATLPVAAFGSVHKGSAIRLELDSLPGSSLAGKVAEMEAGAESASHTLKARVDLPKVAGLQSGMYGRAFFARGNRRAVMVSCDAVVSRGQLRGVYIVEASGMIRWRVLTLGNKLGDQVEVLSGLDDGETVVLNPGMQELEGKKVSAAAAADEEKPR